MLRSPSNITLPVVEESISEKRKNNLPTREIERERKENSLITFLLGLHATLRGSSNRLERSSLLKRGEKNQTWEDHKLAPWLGKRCTEGSESSEDEDGPGQDKGQKNPARDS